MPTATTQRNRPKANRLSREEQEILSRIISLQQTDGASESAEIDKDFLLEDGNYDLFFLHYFPNEIQAFEPMNYRLFDFLENERQGLIWCPGGWGKSTSLRIWSVYALCRDPQVSIIYCEKSEPAATACARSLMDVLEFNEELIHDFGPFKSRWWSAEGIVIKQRPKIIKPPSVAFFGAQSKATLGSRCNIMIVDDPVTADNSTSELERIRLWDWYSQAAATCPSPLPLTNERYLKKLFLVGTTFHMADLYHEVLKTGMYKHLWMQAVDMKTGICHSPRFTWRSTEQLKKDAEGSEADAELLRRVVDGKVLSLGDYRKAHGTKAFMRRYQNEVRDDSTAKFPSLWFRGGDDDWAPPGGYPGCLEDGDHHPFRSLGERPETKSLTVVTGVDPAAGTKGQYTVRFACVTLGCDLIHDPNTVYLLDMDFGQQPMVSDNRAKESQVDIVLRHVKGYGGRVILETNNVQGVWAQELRKEANRRGTYITISGHNTTKGKKVDEDQGIEAMTAMIENGHLRLPYKLPSDRKKVDELIEEFTYWGYYATDDIMMAFWFAWRVLDRMKRNRSTKPPEKREKPAYMLVGDRWNFPPHWTPERIEAFFAGNTEEEANE